MRKRRPGWEPKVIDGTGEDPGPALHCIDEWEIPVDPPDKPSISLKTGWVEGAGVVPKFWIDSRDGIERPVLTREEDETAPVWVEMTDDGWVVRVDRTKLPFA